VANQKNLVFQTQERIRREQEREREMIKTRSKQGPYATNGKQRQFLCRLVHGTPEATRTPAGFFFFGGGGVSKNI